MNKRIVVAAFSASLVAFAAQAEVMDRPTGFKFGEHLTLRPYVDLSFVIDSNQDQQPDPETVCSWVINPGLTLTYKAENWALDLGAFYRYTAYDKYVRELDSNSYGENLNYRWSNARADEKGWSLMLTEAYQKTTEDDDMSYNNGRGLWRDRQEFRIGGVVERRFTDKLHADVNLSYNWLDYVNDGHKYGNLYGWSRWTAGLQGGYALSHWTDILASVGYQRYYQDNANDLTGNSATYNTANLYSRESQGVSFMVGMGSYATDRISYRLMGGWSLFKYADVETMNGFTYSATGNWKITDTWNTMLLAASNYQPSEREYGSANRVDSISWGLSKSMVRGKLNATINLTFRRETREYTDRSAYEYDENIFSGRLGLNYTLNRFVGLFAHLEYQNCFFDGNAGGMDRDYDRIRGTLGVRLTY